MSIEIENPETTLEKVDAAANLVEQMSLAYRMQDSKHFDECLNKVRNLLAQATDELDV